MTDTNFDSGRSDHHMDAVLKKSFGKSRPLSEDFEDRVMSTIHAQEARSRKGKIVMISMMIYWAIAIMTGSWLVFGIPAGETTTNATNTMVLWSLITAMIIFVFFIVRQASLRLSDLFMGTIS